MQPKLSTPVVNALGSSGLQGFHVSRPARDLYQFAESLFVPIGNVVVPNFRAARVIAQQINQQRDLSAHPEQAIYAGQINAMAMIHEIQRLIFRRWLMQRRQAVLGTALEWASEQYGADAIDAVLTRYVEMFPPLVVYHTQIDTKRFLNSTFDGVPAREVVLEELLLLWLANANPAFAPFNDLFSAAPLIQHTVYAQLISGLQTFFNDPSLQDEAGRSIIDVLLATAHEVPMSLEEQLGLLLEDWEGVLGDFATRMLSALDLIKEEQKPMFGGWGGDSAPVMVPSYKIDEMLIGAEAFTADRDWMPRLVLIAKNTYVWLDQLSKKYQRAITRLDQIPDEELDLLARWGVTGLWLIGLWERSQASRRMKQIMGKADAVASAYSLYDYQIAGDLGGTEACDTLRKRAWQRGIRLASDMVPNHVGIDGKWLIEHPEWFVSTDYSPYPTYTFNGPDLSQDERIGIFLEDHYYDHTDAAVVFKRVDRWTGSTTYVYHGNDGTTIPWNDTAQLDYLNPNLREAVIQTILHVARQFPVIRFDAAMTIAKRHVQRLWYPEPGRGGSVPSRAEFALSAEQFEALLPQEFWREVVDRAAVEAPDTLLLAEAFWMMESYFVRTLGMHRVYNSAFMNTLRDEENAKYRLIMKNTLEFDPEILRRYVNFLNNPDEKTAVEQFGKGDKYFGLCTMMVTMPGLPMFGHGQIEGFTEKYGMEYQHAYYDEQPDGWLVARHEREIFPLVRRRYLFAGVEHFLLYDFFVADGSVNEDVFAYSNRSGDERTLVVYHNVFAEVSGWIRNSAAFSVKTGNGDERALTQKTLGEGLSLFANDNQFWVFRDEIAGLEYIRHARELSDNGLFIALGAYKYHVFLDFRLVTDSAAQPYGQLAASLGGRGVPNVREALQELFYQPVREPFRALVNGDTFRRLFEARLLTPTQTLDTALLDEVEHKVEVLFRAAEAFIQPPADTVAPAEASSADTPLAIDTPDAAKILGTLSDDGDPIVPITTAIDSTAADPDASEVDRIVEVSRAVRAQLEAILRLPLLAPVTPSTTPTANTTKATSKAETAKPAAVPTPMPTVSNTAIAALGDDPAAWGGAFGWLFVSALDLIDPAGEPLSPVSSNSTIPNTALNAISALPPRSRDWLDEWRLDRLLSDALRAFGVDEAGIWQTVAAVKLVAAHPQVFTVPEVASHEDAAKLLAALINDAEAQRFLGVNRFNNTVWFDGGAFDRLLHWLLIMAALTQQSAESLAAREQTVAKLRAVAAKSGYELDKLTVK